MYVRLCRAPPTSSAAPPAAAAADAAQQPLGPTEQKAAATPPAASTQPTRSEEPAAKPPTANGPAGKQATASGPPPAAPAVRCSPLHCPNRAAFSFGILSAAAKCAGRSGRPGPQEGSLDLGGCTPAPRLGHPARISCQLAGERAVRALQGGRPGLRQVLPAAAARAVELAVAGRAALPAPPPRPAGTGCSSTPLAAHLRQMDQKPQL